MSWRGGEKIKKGIEEGEKCAKEEGEGKEEE